jgi:membrane-anchored mycosin MYCP
MAKPTPGRALLAGFAATMATLATMGPATAAPSRPAAGCAQPTGVYADETPWPQKLLDPARVWPLTAGAGVSVAVLGAGVDANNAQFAQGQVRAGIDLTGARQPATTDCDGRGTFAAGIIAARVSTATIFSGVAPDARIIPIRYTHTAQQGAATSDPNLLAAAIQSAVGAGAKVICVVAPSATDSPALHAAVAKARAADAVVVSPVATAQSSNGAPTYPTTDDLVLSVAAIGADGGAVSTQTGDYVDVAGPGKGLVGLAAGTGRKLGHVWPVDDPAFAAAYVAGVIALVRSYRPNLSAAQVVQRIERTATRTAAGARDPRLGWGVVDAYAAVSAEGMDGATSAVATAPQRVQPARVAAMTRQDEATAATAIGGLVLSVTLALGVAVIRRGRSRGWRSARRN